MILLRHGQSEFNLHFTATRCDPGIVDPALTELGRQQAEQAADALIAGAGAEGIERILASPYTRALQTAAPLARRLGIPVVVQPVVRERFAFTCDVGSTRAVLSERFPEHDFSGIDEVWWPAVEEPTDSIIARAALFRAEMQALPDWNRTVVVSHWGFILSLTGERINNGEWLRYDPTGPAPAEIVWRH